MVEEATAGQDHGLQLAQAAAAGPLASVAMQARPAAATGRACRTPPSAPPVAVQVHQISADLPPGVASGSLVPVEVGDRAFDVVAPDGVLQSETFCAQDPLAAKQPPTQPPPVATATVVVSATTSVSAATTLGSAPAETSRAAFEGARRLLREALTKAPESRQAVKTATE